MLAAEGGRGGNGASGLGRPGAFRISRTGAWDGRGGNEALHREREQGNAAPAGFALYLDAYLEIRELTEADWPAVRSIYEQGIAGRNATFETEAPDWETWSRSQLDRHRLVAVEDGRVVGWIAVHPVSPRACYAGVVEHSVYVADEAQGKGIGRALLERLTADTEQAGIWTIQTGIFPENEGSLALHVKCGFRVVGTQQRVGKLDGVWRDVVVVERRSEVVT